MQQHLLARDNTFDGTSSQRLYSLKDNKSYNLIRFNGKQCMLNEQETSIQFSFRNGRKCLLVSCLDSFSQITKNSISELQLFSIVVTINLNLQTWQFVILSVVEQINVFLTSYKYQHRVCKLWCLVIQITLIYVQIYEYETYDFISISKFHKHPQITATTGTYLIKLLIDSAIIITSIYFVKLLTAMFRRTHDKLIL